MSQKTTKTPARHKGWLVASSTTALVCCLLGISHFHEKNVRRKQAETKAEVSELKAARAELRARTAEAKSAKLEAETERIKAENLTIRNKALALLHESRGHGIAVLDSRGLVREWNPALEKWTGYTEAEMIGHDILAIMPMDKQDKHARGYAEIINDPKAIGKTFNVECELVPRTSDKPPIKVTVAARIVEPVGGGERYALAIIDRASRVVKLQETPEPVTVP